MFVGRFYQRFDERTRVYGILVSAKIFYYTLAEIAIGNN